MVFVFDGDTSASQRSHPIGLGLAVARVACHIRSVILVRNVICISFGQKLIFEEALGHRILCRSNPLSKMSLRVLELKQQVFSFTHDQKRSNPKLVDRAGVEQINSQKTKAVPNFV